MIVAPGVRRLVAPNPSPMTADGSNTYLIGEGAVAVVDPGPSTPLHLDAIVAAAPRITRILVTHGHGDHVDGVPGLEARTGATVAGHPDVACVKTPVADGETFAVDGREVVALFTPGHSEDHFCYWLPAERVLFAGDLVAGVGTHVLSDQPGALGRYFAALERLIALGPSMILSGHGPVVEDGLAKMRADLAHRKMREDQIVAALRARAHTVDELVAAMYAETPVVLHPMAARNVRMHLELLADLGRARAAGSRWELVV